MKSSGRSLIVAIDASKSMLADDVKPSRLERAQLAAQDLVKKLRKDRIGLMQFAGTANMLASFTEDTDAVQEIIDSIDTDGVALGGSNLANAIEYAIDVFHNADLSGQQAMVIFSDGEELQGAALAAARKAREAKIAIICVAVGTAAGAIIPNPNIPGEYFRDKNQKPVLTKLHKEVLEKIADITGGLYLKLDGQGINDSRIDVILQKLHRSDMKSKTVETSVDRYRWPLAAGLLSLVAAFLTGIVRRHRAAVPQAALAGAVTVLLFFIAGPVSVFGQDKPPPAPGDQKANAAAQDNPEEEPPKQGDPWKFYREGDWKNAVFNFKSLVPKARTEKELDRVLMGSGVAGFKAAMNDPKKFDTGMIEHAIDAFGQALASPDPAVRETAHYNLANSIYERVKAAEAERDAAFNKTKKKKEKKKYRLTLKYLDGVIRQLENSIEHYQETLALNGDNKDAKSNLDAVVALVKTLRDIRKEKAESGEGDGEEGEGTSKGKGQGKGKQKGQGKGKGQGQGQGSGSGEDEGEGGEDGDDEGDGGDKDGKGKGGDDEGDEGEGGKGKGDEEGKGDGDKSNREFDGKLKADGDTGNHDSDNGGKGTGDGSESGSGEVARQKAIQKLKNLSQELPPRERTRSVPETRPDKDW
jgi:Ca-activated chloride channel family protein